MDIEYKQTADPDLVQRQWMVPMMFLMGGLITGMIILKLAWPFPLAVLAGPAVLVVFILKPQYGLYAFFTMIILMTEYFPETASGKNMFIFNDADTIQGLPSPLIMSLLMMFTVFFAWRYFIEKKPSVIPLRYLFLLVVILTLATLTGMRNGWDPIDIRVNFMAFLFPAFCFYLCVNILTEMKQVYWMVGIIFAACVVKSAILGLYYLEGQGIVIGTAQAAVTYDPSDLMAFSTMLLVAFAIVSKRGIRLRQILLFLAAAAPILFAVLYSFRRGIWIGTTLAVVLYFLMSPLATKKRIIRGLVLFTLLLAILGNIDLGGSSGSGSIINRLSSILDAKQDSNRHHMLESRQALSDISKSPLLGLGLGSKHKPVKYIDWSADEQPVGTVHNTWVLIWMKTGLVGVFFFLWVGLMYLRSIAVIVRHNRDNRYPVILALAASIGLWLIQSIITPIPDYYHRSFLIMLFSALVVSSAHILSNSSKDRVER